MIRIVNFAEPTPQVMQMRKRSEYRNRLIRNIASTAHYRDWQVVILKLYALEHTHLNLPKPESKRFDRRQQVFARENVFGMGNIEMVKTKELINRFGDELRIADFEAISLLFNN